MTITSQGRPVVRHALVVEDQEPFRLLARQAIASLDGGWQVTSCGTGAAALAAIADPGRPADLILVDLGLPDMSGIRLIQAAVKRRPGTPVMVLSGMTDEESVLAAIGAGARGYVRKDDPVAAIASAIRLVLEGQYPISPSLARYLFQLAAPPENLPSAGRIGLSPKELELLRLLAQGLTYDEAARSMGVALSTVQSHVRRMYGKLEVDSKVKAIIKARERGWL